LSGGPAQPAGEAARRARPGLGARLSVALASGLFLLAALEIGARLYLGDRMLTGLPVGAPKEACAQYDPDLGWANKPNVRTRVEAPRFEYSVAINSRGLRDREHPYEKPDGVFRIALLGDSIAWGWGVDDGLSFADLVEERLGPEVEVINLGVPGYGTDQQLWVLEHEARRYDPDLVLLCFLLNDIEGNGNLQSSDMPKPRYERGPDGAWRLANHPVPRTDLAATRELSFQQWLWTHSGLYQALRPADSQRELVAGAEGALSPPSPAGGGRRSADGTRANALAAEQAQIAALCAELTDDEAVTRWLLGRIRASCDELGVPLVAFSVAHHHDRHLYSPNFPHAPLSGGDPTTELTRRLAEAGRELGFRTFSVDRAMFAETEAGVTLTCGDGHLNERGNEVVAERIVEELRPLLPPR